MNNLLNETYGIDEPLQEIQIDLYKELSNIWQGEIEGYGKISRNPLNKGNKQPEAYATSKLIIPEWFNAEKQDYEEVYYNNDKSCVFFFMQSSEDDTEDDYVFSNTSKVVFMVDLDRIYPNKAQRLDSKIQEEAVQVLRSIAYRKYKILGIERRIESIFQEFSTSNIRQDNMDKNHVFAVRLQLNYTITDKCD